MQDRLSRDPYEALGLTGSPTATDVRDAFLVLTKQFHPARFARMSTEIQKLSNEVFLSLRAAHDNLARPSVTPKSTGVMPAFKKPGQPAPATSRVPTGQLPTQPPPVTGRTPTGPVPRAAPIAPQVARAGSSASRVSPTSSRLAAGPMPVAVDPARELAAIHELIKAGQLAPAASKLEALTKQAPAPKIQALLHYVRGREAQLAGNREEARGELLDALQLDEDLQLAKTALAEVTARRK